MFSSCCLFNESISQRSCDDGRHKFPFEASLSVVIHLRRRDVGQSKQLNETFFNHRSCLKNFFQANELLVTSRSVDDDDERKLAMDQALTMYKKVANQIHLPTVCAQLQEGWTRFLSQTL